MTLKTIAALQEKATKGPWEAKGQNVFYGQRCILATYGELEIMSDAWTPESIPVAEANAQLIAACGSFDFTALCDEMERMRKALAFYADEESHRAEWNDEWDAARTPVQIDEGQRAREALGETVEGVM